MSKETEETIELEVLRYNLERMLAMVPISGMDKQKLEHCLHFIMIFLENRIHHMDEKLFLKLSDSLQLIKDFLTVIDAHESESVQAHGNYLFGDKK